MIRVSTTQLTLARRAQAPADTAYVLLWHRSREGSAATPGARVLVAVAFAAVFRSLFRRQCFGPACSQTAGRANRGPHDGDYTPVEGPGAVRREHAGPFFTPSRPALPAKASKRNSRSPPFDGDPAVMRDNGMSPIRARLL